MTIDNMIDALLAMKEKVGGNEEVPMMTTLGENDYILVEYPIVGDFEDQDGNNYKCAFVGSSGGEEFTKVGVPHYEWKPKTDKMEYAKTDGKIRFDGYVRMSEDDLSKFPKPTIIDASGEILVVRLSNPCWEDASFVENEDSGNQKSPIPGANTDEEFIEWHIEPKSGTILNWHSGVYANCWYKIVDEFEYYYDGFHYEGYVPDFMSIDEDGDGDYVNLTIHENGKIDGWNYEKFMNEHEKIHKLQNHD